MRAPPSAVADFRRRVSPPIVRRFALRGNPLSGNCECRRTVVRVDNWYDRPITRFRISGISFSGGAMDLAMAMGVALLGMFAGSTIYFFHKVSR
jgi:hypothetical protein